MSKSIPSKPPLGAVRSGSAATTRPRVPGQRSPAEPDQSPALSEDDVVPGADDDLA